MSTLYAFECEQHFVPGELAPQGAGVLIQDIEEFSIAGAAPWTSLLAKGAGDLGQPTELPAATVLALVAEGRYRNVILRRGVDRYHEEFVRLGEFAGVLESRFRLSIAARSQEPLFIRLCERMRPRHTSYLPYFEGLGGNSRLTLTMALRRDYSLFRVPAEDLHVIRARTLAPLIPKIEFMGLRLTDVRPNELGWLNYWSAETAAILGFPDAAKDSRILPLCRQLSDGAWLVKFTDEPLDLEREEHVEAIVWAYWRFDKVGKRLQPADGNRRPRVKKARSGMAVPAGSRTFVLRERDEGGKWWEAAAKPIVASSAEDALRIHFSTMAHGRPPLPRETLASLRAAYDAVAAEVGLTRANDMEAVEAAD